MKIILSVLTLLTVLLSSVAAHDTVQVKVGWNNIGAITAGAATEVLCTDPPGIITTSFFGYIPGAGYATADTLEKGLGYWVKVSSDGLLVFNGSCGGGGGTCSVSSVSYDGETYPTVSIGSQCWLAKNLNVGTMVTGVTEQTDNSTLEKYC